MSNLAQSRDTSTMLALLTTDHAVYDVKDAGTTCRFLTAYLALSGHHSIIDGTPRMRQRPIGILVDALKKLGADITYTHQEGYLPLKIGSFNHSGISELSVKADISSQYISALLMVGATLPDGLTIRFDGPLTSRPYLEMTAELIRKFGGDVNFGFDCGNEFVTIKHGQFTPQTLQMSPDWSAAGYWYSITALHPDPDFQVLLEGLSLQTLQGDRRLAQVFQALGVSSEQTQKGLLLSKDQCWTPNRVFVEVDCTDIPDQAQTLAVAFGALGQPLRLTGLHTLRIKETDRIGALQAELPKVGISMLEVADEVFDVVSARNQINLGTLPVINTYHDHRMAMSFAPLGLIRELTIIDPSVVVKSYPDFWQAIGASGLQVSVQ